MTAWEPPGAAERRSDPAPRAARSPSSAPPPTRRARSNFVLTYLLSSSADYEVWPVTPNETEILGVQVLPVARRPARRAGHRRRLPPRRSAPAVAREAVEAGAGAFWMQLGLHSDEAVEIAHAAGLDVVSNRCVKIEHARFHGGLHLAGFDTGVISSRRTRG